MKKLIKLIKFLNNNNVVFRIDPVDDQLNFNINFLNNKNIFINIYKNKYFIVHTSDYEYHKINKNSLFKILNDTF